MSILHQTIEQAMLDRAPALHQQLKAEGKLTVFVRQKAQEIGALSVQMTQATRLSQGWDKQGLTPLEMTGRLNAARSEATESVLDEALQFPPGGTSSPSLG